MWNIFFATEQNQRSLGQENSFSEKCIAWVGPRYWLVFGNVFRELTFAVASIQD